MLTRCPQCQAVHPLDVDRPSGDRGVATCAACGASFDAYAHLADASRLGPAIDETAADAAEGQGELFGPPPKPRVAVPSFAQVRGRLPRPRQWRWWLAGAGLLLLLLAIYPVADRERLARDANWRPFEQRLCAVLRCRIAPWHEPSAFEITARDVRAHPSAPGALLITVSFRNDAAFAQALPLLEMTMSDLDGRDVGMRRFRPAEYLGGAARPSLVSPGQSVDATLEVMEPGPDAVAFKFDFR